MNGQLNVTPITDKQPQPACKFTITCALDGFPIEISGEGRAGDLKTIIDRLKAIGADPPQAAKIEPTKAASAPLCPVHNSKMKQGRRGFFCPRKDEYGDYCKEVA